MLSGGGCLGCRDAGRRRNTRAAQRRLRRRRHRRGRPQRRHRQRGHNRARRQRRHRRRGIAEQDGKAVTGGGGIAEQPGSAVTGGGGIAEQDGSAVTGGGGIIEQDGSAVTGGGGITDPPSTVPCDDNLGAERRGLSAPRHEYFRPSVNATPSASPESSAIHASDPIHLMVHPTARFRNPPFPGYPPGFSRPPASPRST